MNWDLEISSVPFFIIFNALMLVIGYNFWHHFPREGGKYRNPSYYLNMIPPQPEQSKDFKDDSSKLIPTSKLLSSCIQPGLDSRSG